MLPWKKYSGAALILVTASLLGYFIFSQSAFIAVQKFARPNVKKFSLHTTPKASSQLPNAGAVSKPAPSVQPAAKSPAPPAKSPAPPAPPSKQPPPPPSAEQPLRYDLTPAPAAFSKENLELYIRVKFGFGWGEVTSLLLPSLQLFWPHINVLMVFDAEEKEDQEAAKNIAKLTEKFAPVKFRSALKEQYTNSGLIGLRNKIDPKLVWHGYQREHLDMMYADEQSNAKYIAIADSDALVITTVMPTTVFSPEGKPIIIGTLSRSAMGSDVNWVNGILGVQFMIKKDYVASCMSYFPVILKREHIKMFRQHVEKVHNKSFVEVYKEMFLLTKWYCHYSMMCNYVWHFHRDEYDFHYHSYVRWQVGWDAPQPNQIKDFSFLNDQNKRPIVRASTHASYTLGYGHLYKKYIPEAPANAFLQGFCFVAFAQCRNPPECEKWKKACAAKQIDVNALQILLFRFESWQTWEWDPHIRDAQKEHMAALKKYTYWTSYGAYILEKTQPNTWKSFQPT